MKGHPSGGVSLRGRTWSGFRACAVTALWSGLDLLLVHREEATGLGREAGNHQLHPNYCSPSRGSWPHTAPSPGTRTVWVWLTASPLLVLLAYISMSCICCPMRKNTMPARVRLLPVALKDLALASEAVSLSPMAVFGSFSCFISNCGISLSKQKMLKILPGTIA